MASLQRYCYTVNICSTRVKGLNQQSKVSNRDRQRPGQKERKREIKDADSKDKKELKSSVGD